MQFEAGSQPERGAESPFPPLDPKYPDLPAQTWYSYGVKEGIPRLLDLWDRKKIKVTSHMVGQAVDRNPRLAKEIVERGHEASGHGQTWAPQYSMSREEEKTSYQASVKSIEKATGNRPAHAFAQELKDAFDVLYEEAATRRRLLSVSAHDRISGHPARVKAFAEFIDYAQKHKGVWFARKDEIARWTLESANTLQEK
jgi:peptidoglycan/xylan/chitin deacetylase (PgdA/CDA1 family)